ncbi:MAG: hypothetical protein ABIH66_11305 [bacterium]
MGAWKSLFTAPPLFALGSRMVGQPKSFRSSDSSAYFMPAMYVWARTGEAKRSTHSLLRMPWFLYQQPV